MLQAGATDLYIHKYLGPTDQGPSADATQPQYDQMDPMHIQDLLFLENRDRTYEPDIIRLRGHYNVQNLDFDLSQFGLFLNNDILFITVHYNSMIDLLGRKLIVGDVLELPHLLDYHPLNDAVPTSLRRFYHVTDGNYASEGFSPTWFPHLWRIKCEPLVDSQEFSQILSAPINQDNYMGLWNSTEIYSAGYTITYGGTNYTALIDVPIGIAPPDPTYWEADANQNLKDILSTYNNNIAVNDAVLAEAERQVPKSGYDTSKLFILPTYGEDSTMTGQPAPSTNIVTGTGAPGTFGTVVLMRSPKYKTASPVIRVAPGSVENMAAFLQMCLELVAVAPAKTDSGSGSVETEYVLCARAMGPVTGPYGTSDNTYATGDQNPAASGFTGTVNQTMDYRADCDPAYQFIARMTPRSFGYTVGYLTGSDQAPNGLPTGVGHMFPHNPQVGDYFLRTDFFPQALYRWDSRSWVRISENVRTETSLVPGDQTQRASFINNTNLTNLTGGGTIPQRQSLSTVLQPDPVILPKR